MNYKFVKIVNPNSNEIFKNWYFYCESIDSLIEHFKRYIKCEIDNGFKDALNVAMHNMHYSNNWASTVNKIMSIKGGSFLEISTELENKMFQSRASLIKSDGACLLTDGLQAMPITSFNIIDECYKEELVWPTYTENDIKIVSWPGGAHFYAKIGGMDVVNEKGEQKWNTWDEAFNEAKQFLIKKLW